VNPRQIIIRGAREHNLKNIDLAIPKDRFVVVTGLSGSGKSSLAFDTIYAEGQRRYVESLSSYARQFLEQMDKPDVDSIEGLSPAISIEQRTASKNPRSTVGTVTQVYDYMRVLFTHLGRPHCPSCGKPIESQTPQQIVDRILYMPEGSSLLVLSPIVRGRKGEYRQELEDLRRSGFVRVKLDGMLRELSEDIVLDKHKKHDIDVVVDRIVLHADIRKRVTDSVETALRLSNGLLKVEVGEGTSLAGSVILFSEKFSCPECGVSLPEIAPRMFSFNSPYGACRRCDGLGTVYMTEYDEESEWPPPSSLCPECSGSRLRKESLCITIADKSIAEVSSLSVQKALEYFQTLSLSPREREISRRILKEITDRLSFLVDVGLDYLTLDRPSASLAGGESQRIRLATQVGSSLVGVLYILDEPSIGLHQRDNRRLLQTLKKLRDLGNTVIVVEHDEETVLSADYVVDLGPGAGLQGGYVVACGTPKEIASHPDSLTGQYLSRRLSIPVPATRRKPSAKTLFIVGAKGNNLKEITVSIPLGTFTCITGVSGSGKSTLIVDTLYRAVAQRLYKARVLPLSFREIKGINEIDKVVDIDQSPIGRTPRSNPVTYTKAFDPIRHLFAQVLESRARGYSPGRFSFNVKGGRCEACGGGGMVKMEMHFLPDVYVRCDMCHGMRYNRDTLEIRWKGKNIHEVLGMTVKEAMEFFGPIPHIRRILATLNDVGLGYITLGQSATTLSGGEAQRIKLSRELSKRGTGRTLYILDEPTTGLHFADIQMLLDVLNRLVDAGNTVVVIEHNMEVLKSADYIIDLGPEGGEKGGEVVATGSPEEVSRAQRSYTGRFLKKALYPGVAVMPLAEAL